MQSFLLFAVQVSLLLASGAGYPLRTPFLRRALLDDVGLHSDQMRISAGIGRPVSVLRYTQCSLRIPLWDCRTHLGIRIRGAQSKHLQDYPHLFSIGIPRSKSRREGLKCTSKDGAGCCVEMACPIILGDLYTRFNLPPAGTSKDASRNALLLSTYYVRTYICTELRNLSSDSSRRTVQLVLVRVVAFP